MRAAGRPTHRSRVNRPWAVALGLIAEALTGEPPHRVHPVARFGSLMEEVEGLCYKDSRPAGVLYLLSGSTVAAAVGACASRTPGAVTASTMLTVGGRELRLVALRVARYLESFEIEAARSLLSSLVGRDTGLLDEKEIARAVVESVAENTVDAVVAPALWALVGGTSGALVYRAVNTLDSMVGHRSSRYERFGWASARADDLMGLAPSRLTALLVGLVRPKAIARIRDAVLKQAPAHPSPNAGVSEAAFAGALGVRLGGENRYGGRTDLRPQLGTGRTPEASDIKDAVRLSADVTKALAALLVVTGAVSNVVQHRAGPRRAS